MKVVMVGPSYRFSSGLSAYTHRVSHALAESIDVSVLLLRRLLPQGLYPGRAHVGKELGFPPYRVAAFDGVDWFWGTSLWRGFKFILAEDPAVVIFQWWTIVTVHTYLVLAWLCRRRGIKTIIEFHELQDPAESAITGMAKLNRVGLRWLLSLADGIIVHNRHDRDLIISSVGAPKLPVHIVPHGPYDHLAGTRPVTGDPSAESGDATCLLFFGLIRPYKGLEDLLEAFNGLSREEASFFRLSIVGETWEGWTKPARLVDQSPHKDRIEFVNRYVADSEVAGFFSRADALILPYRRASSSGPLNIGLASGLAVVMYDVPSLVDTVGGYEGATIVPSGDIGALRDAIKALRSVKGRRYPANLTWSNVVEAYEVAASAVCAV